MLEISSFIASRAPSSLEVERRVYLNWYCEILLKGNFLILDFLPPVHAKVLILLQKQSKFLESSKYEDSLAVGIKLRPLLSKRIWGSDNSLRYFFGVFL